MGRRQGNISSFFQPMAAHKARGDDVDSTPEKHSKTGADNGEETAGSMFYGETRFVSQKFRFSFLNLR